jgi:hypothetical protein
MADTAEVVGVPAPVQQPAPLAAPVEVDVRGREHCIHGGQAAHRAPVVGVADVGRLGEHVVDAQRRCLGQQFGAGPNQPARSAEVLEQFVRDAVVASEVQPRPLEPQRGHRDHTEHDEQREQ